MIKIIENGIKGLNSVEEVLNRKVIEEDISSSVKGIIGEVIEGGDEALKALCEKYDGFMPEALEVAREEIDEAFEQVLESSPATIRALENAASRITRYHSAQKREGFELVEKRDSDGGAGVLLMQKILPIKRAGLYIPGGTASYPSTVLMNVIPAKIAGVEEIIMVSPPSKDGTIAPIILAAAKVAGVDRIFKIGGAQAVAALAYGTESIPKVDKITGPGNAYVAEAKKQVFGKVGIDMIAGPSEILVIADSGDAAVLAADMLSQAEHDTMASAVLITTDKNLAEQVAKEIEVQLKELPREDIARASIEANGKIFIADTIEEAIDISNELAPEHLEMYVNNPFKYIDSIKNAGSVFLGKNCPEALGDYYAGPNHTLPTNGTAKFASPLSVDDFIKKTSFTFYSEEALRDDVDDVVLLAREEGLEGHARSPLYRTEKNFK